LLLGLAGCEKDDSEEKMAGQRAKLEKYIEDNNITTEPTSSGLYFLPVEEGNGTQADSSADVMIFYYTERLLDGTIVYSTSKKLLESSGIEYTDLYIGPYQQRLDKIGPSGLKEGLEMMSEGDSARLILPFDLAYGEIAFENVPAYSNLIFDVRLLKVVNDMKVHERELINNYLDTIATDNIDSLTTGVIIISDKPGIGEKPGLYKTVSISVKGTTITGIPFFDSGETDRSWSIQPGDTEIEGLNYALLEMKVGEQARAIIPYFLAYDKNQQGNSWNLPPYATLVFDITLKSIK
ncbi:MAG: FKBP-type peptidyl-prolyl cis-trans isomerase, partial [Bacteroidota bacterium]